MSGELRIELVVGFEVEEEILPLLAEVGGDVVPQPLDASVVYAPVNE